MWALGLTFYEVITLKDLVSTSIESAKTQLEDLNFEDLTSNGSKNIAVGAVQTLRACQWPGTMTAEIIEMCARDPSKRASAATLVSRNINSERLQKVLKQTASISDMTEHFKDFARIIVESEEAAPMDPPKECEEQLTVQRTEKKGLRRSATQPLDSYKSSREVSSDDAPLQSLRDLKRISIIPENGPSARFARAYS
jgi:hypothetical protein